MFSLILQRLWFLVIDAIKENIHLNHLISYQAGGFYNYSNKQRMFSRKLIVTLFVTSCFATVLSGVVYNPDTVCFCDDANGIRRPCACTEKFPPSQDLQQNHFSSYSGYQPGVQQQRYPSHSTYSNHYGQQYQSTHSNHYQQRVSPQWQPYQQHYWNVN